MTTGAQERTEAAIIHLIAEFPGLLSPTAIRAALKAVFGLTDVQAAKAQEELGATLRPWA